MPSADQPELAGRECIACHRLKLEDHFTGGELRCKSCRINRRRKRRSTNLEAHVAGMITESKHRAKGRGVGFTITADDVSEMWADQEGRCAISGMPLTHHRRGDRDAVSLTNASLDRITPSGDYSLENVQLVCIGINMMRRRMELDEFITMCRQVAYHQSRYWRDV